MEWVKSTVGYYRHLAIATGSDALEVMFKRGDALAGETAGEGSVDGFIPDAMLTSLTRRPAQARKLASQLVTAGLWDRVPGGYQIVDFEKINAELIRLAAKKKRDRDRKRVERAAARTSSEDASADSRSDGPGDSLYESERKSKKKTSAAAAADARAAAAPVENASKPLDLPPAVEILRLALEARKLIVRWDRLTPGQLDDITALVDLHGDGPLVRAALAAYQPNSPAGFAQAWIRTWQALPAPGTSLRAVPAQPCPRVGHTGTASHCKECAGETKARGDNDTAPSDPRALAEELAATRQRIADADQTRKANP